MGFRVYRGERGSQAPAANHASRATQITRVPAYNVDAPSAMEQMTLSLHLAGTPGSGQQRNPVSQNQTSVYSNAALPAIQYPLHFCCAAPAVVSSIEMLVASTSCCAREAAVKTSSSGNDHIAPGNGRLRLAIRNSRRLRPSIRARVVCAACNLQTSTVYSSSAKVLL